MIRDVNEPKMNGVSSHANVLDRVILGTRFNNDIGATLSCSYVLVATFTQKILYMGGMVRRGVGHRA